MGNGHRRDRRDDRATRRKHRPCCEVMERRSLLSIFTVTNVSDSPKAAGTLRLAIQQVNDDNQTDTIDTISFDIALTGVQTIQPTSPLPALTKRVVIDGTTQPNYAGSPLIQLDGSLLGSGTNGIVLSAGSSTVEGLSVVNFTGSGIVLNSSSGNVLAANYVGYSAASKHAAANGTGISIIGSSNNTIGGTSAGSGNVISGNSGDGILIESGSGTANGNELVGNLIGTDPSGTVAVGNSQSGVDLSGASGTEVGLAAAGLGNVISGNKGAGISLISGTTATVILNNEIGVAIDGKSGLGNQGDGIYFNNSPFNQVGGTQPLEGNLIGKNLGDGIDVTGASSSLLVEGNFIGTDVTAALNLGNQADGISLASSSNTIGGTISGAGNTIDYNGGGGAGGSGSGVRLVGNPNQDAILSNLMYKNAVLGINLGDGPTPNHLAGTAGPNNYQNYPTISLAQTDGTTTTVQGSLNSIPNTSFLLQFFASSSASLSGFGQGQLLLGSDTVMTNAAGLANFTYPISAATPAGDFISATATDPTGNTSEFAKDIQTQGQINLFLTGSSNPPSVLAGDQVTYVLTVSNTGTAPADNVVVSNQLPAGVTLVSVSVSQGFVQPSMGPSQVANLGTIAVGGSATMTIVGQTGVNTPLGPIADTASVTSLEPDPTPANELVSINTTVESATDLAVQLSVPPGPILAGSDLTYTITATNNGPEPATNVTVSLPIAAGAAFVSTNLPGATYSGGVVRANLGNLGVTSHAIFQVVVQALAPGSLSETVTVSGDIVDSNTSNNTSTVVTLVNPAAAVQVTLVASESPVVLGQDFNYTVTIKNAGPSDASAVVLTDTLPTGVAFVLATSDQNVTPSYSAGVVSLSLSALKAGATATLTITVNPTAAPGSSLSDSALVTHQVTDPDPANESATLVTPVQGLSDLGIKATSEQPTGYVGQNVTYLLSVTNSGPNDEPDAVVSWQIPSDASFVSAGSTQGNGSSIANGIVSVDLGTLAAGDTLPVIFTITPLAGAVGLFTTEFSVLGQSVDQNASNNTASASVQVSAASDLAVSIAPGASGPDDGSDWTYTITVHNLGLSDASGVTVTAPLPSALHFISGTPSQGSQPVFHLGNLTAALGAIPAGKSATVNVIVLPTSSGSFTLTSSVAGNQYDPVTANNQTSLPVTTAPSSSLSVSMVPPSASVMSGQEWSFTVTVQNSGPDPATNVVMTIPLGSALVFESATPSQGTTSLSGNQVLASLGRINPGSKASVTVYVMDTGSGTITQTASAVTPENELSGSQLSASANVTVLESAGILQFSAPEFAASENAGVAQLIVTRTDGAAGPVSVYYQTMSAGATPGLDYVANSGTLWFAAGQTQAAIPVTVLADPWDNHDEYVNVVLGSPTGGASLGATGTAVLRIIDVDPNLAPPEVSRLSWSGSSRSITSLNVSFSAPLDPTYAMNQGDYQLVAPGLGNRVIPLTPQSYNPLTFSVTLVPSVALPSGQYYDIQVIGSGPSGIRDIAGNRLDGSGAGQAGSNYFATFAQGSKLHYVDASGNKVSLKLAGSGYLEQVRNASGEGVSLVAVGYRPHHATLSGTVKRGPSRAVKKNKSASSTDLGTLQGFGSFGDIKVLLTSPPFYAKSYPFQRHGKAVLSR